VWPRGRAYGRAMKQHHMGGIQMATFECCGLELVSEEALARHRDETHNAPELAGTCCGIDFPTPEGLKKHLGAAHGRGGEQP
ncbi:MAG: hypothetical protein ACRDGN_11490, partial [bacterium]